VSEVSWPSWSYPNEWTRAPELIVATSESGVCLLGTAGQSVGAVLLGVQGRPS
jgi:hypothetical protein